MAAATLPLPHADSTAPEPAVNFSQARFAFRQLETWLTSEEANLASEAWVEEQLDLRGREVLRLMLQAHLRQRGTGDVGAALRVFSPPDAPVALTPPPDGPAPPDAGQAQPVRHGEKRLHGLTLRTVFGKVEVTRTAYVAAGQDSVHPLDEQLRLPERSFSHPLQERLVHRVVQGPFGEAVADVEHDTGIKMSKRSAEQIVQEAAVDFPAFNKQREVADAKETGPIVVTGIDCKGVPMIKPEQTLRKTRRGKGDKKHKKRMATVATVRTQQRRVRTPEDVVESLFKTTPGEKQPRARKKPAAPKEHKRVWADLIRSKDKVIADVVEEAKRVDPGGVKTHVALCDGERALQKRILPALQAVSAAVLLILDLMHVLEKLWKVAHCFHAEGSAEATAWVRERTLRVLRGEVSQVIKGMRQSATKRGLTGSKRETVDKVARYMRRNKKHMKYDEYLRQGLPIASGCVEGACKNLIKDRMERSGMRWSLEGAEGLIRLRSLHLSGDFDEYWDFHLDQDHRRLYPPGRWEVVEK
jgi:hypothetical protein